MNMTDFKKGIIAGVPIALGYISVSFTFGLQAVSTGLSWWEAALISLTNLTSAGQFAGLNIMLSGGGFWIEMVCTQFVINLRYALMSLSLSQKADKSVKGIHRWLVSFGITDEIFAVSVGNDGEISKNYLYGIIILPLLGWTGGTLLGAAAGSLLPDVVRDSLSIAIYGMFIAIIIPPAKKDSAILKVISISVLLSCMFKWVPVLNNISSGFAIIICTLVAAAVGAVFFPIKEEKE